MTGDVSTLISWFHAIKNHMILFIDLSFDRHNVPIVAGIRATDFSANSRVSRKLNIVQYKARAGDINIPNSFANMLETKISTWRSNCLLFGNQNLYI